MKKVKVSDLMIPLEQYATVSEDATLFDAVIALEKSQEELDRTRYKYLHRAILVLDKNEQVVGKISQLDVIMALEPKYKEMGERLSHWGFSPVFLKSMLDTHMLWASSLMDICTKASKLKAKDFMYTPTEGEYVNADASLEEAMHMLVMGHHHSLLVIEDKKIIGILRLTDVFAEIFDIIKGCEL
jgi:CBS domain-containing protein